MYELEFSKEAEWHVQLLIKTGNQSVINKLYTLLSELTVHPITGTGKPKLLKHELAGYWSRRLSAKHRLVYRIEEERVTVIVLSAKEHYDDK